MDVKVVLRIYLKSLVGFSSYVKSFQLRVNLLATFQTLKADSNFKSGFTKASQPY